MTPVRTTPQTAAEASPRTARATEPAPSLGAVPVCVGCGLAGDVNPINWLCEECWNRRERRQGGGGLRVVTLGGDAVHETPLCPSLRGAAWKYRRYEDVLYDSMAGLVRPCLRCRDWRFRGFDHYRGRGEEVSALV